MTEQRMILTYSALNTLRNCRMKYKLRYMDEIVPIGRTDDNLAYGTLIHAALERWYKLPPDDNRLFKVLDYIDEACAKRDEDPIIHKHYAHARAMITGYAKTYSKEDFEVLEVEKVFETPITNPTTGAQSRTFYLSGKVDGVVQMKDSGEIYLLEHKTASNVDAAYIEQLWTDTQITLYSSALLALGYKIVGVIYNVLLKSRRRQRRGQTEEEYQQALIKACAKNKTGTSKLKRKQPEKNEDFQARLLSWHERDAYHREVVYLNKTRLATAQEEIWESSQQFLDARRRKRWGINPSQCFSWNRPCEYYPYCSSDFNPNVLENFYTKRTAHEELCPSTPQAL